jgi:hypothetical protein
MKRDYNEENAVSHVGMIHAAGAAYDATHDERKHGMENVKYENDILQRRRNDMK